MRSSFWHDLATLVVLAAFAAMGSVYSHEAAAQTPSADQLRMIQSLPPAQRDAVLQQLSGQGASGSATATRPGEVTVTEPVGEDGASRARPEAARELRVRGLEELLIDLVLPGSSDRAPIVERDLRDLRNRIISRNPYDLSDGGVLQLPGLAPIGLSGLSAKEIQKRLAMDPSLHDFQVSVTLLPVEPHGTLALRPFGYEMFRRGSMAFVPGTDIPAPPDYRLGPGDVLEVQFYGQMSRTYTLPIGRDGTIAFPELGPVAVGGLSYAEGQRQVEQRARRQLIGTQARVRLTDLRSIRVLIVGDAEQPGSYVLSGLASVTNALFASGGVKPIGSLRSVEVRREGRLLRRLDLYDVLLRGDSSNDVALQTGDTVFVPPVGSTAAIDGTVRRPAIYELVGDQTLEQLIRLSGGLSPEADRSLLTVERIGDNGVRTAIDVDLSTPAGSAFAIKTGDVVRVRPIGPIVDNGIRVDGHVYRTGVYAWRSGLRLSDVFRSLDDLEPQADPHYLLIRREEPTARRISVVSADLTKALHERGTAADFELAPRDRITVFDLSSPRDTIVGPLLDELRAQSRPDDPAGVVYVEGHVNAAGTYPLETGMRVSDLLRAGGGLQDAAYVNGAELTRYAVVNGERRTVEIKQIDLASIRAGDRSADIQLNAYDLLSVKLTPEWTRQEEVELIGEVRFPGTYLVRRGETLSSVLGRAGGLTSVAFPQGAVFTREDLKQRERDQLDRLASRLQAELATISLQSSQGNSNSAQALAAGQGLLDQLRQTKPVGRLVVDLPAISGPNPKAELDVTLRNGDRLVVPRTTQEVSVFGEVQNPTSHLFRAGETRDQLIELSGGPTARADRKRAYVVRADGSVVASSAGWMRSGNVPLRAGDSVVVPLDAEKMRPLPMWTAVTTIIYNLAIAATAIGRL